MTSIRMIALTAVAVVAWAADAGAQQNPPSNATGSTGAQQSSRSKTGACIVTSTGGETTCTSPIDEAGCRAQGLEMQSKTTWNAGQGCPQ